MKNNFDIGITTFSLRYNFVENLVNKIRELGVINNIFICINGEKDSEFSEEYRKKMLTLSLNNNNVFPIFFVETRGLSKMWNTLIVHSSKDDMLILNDDLILTTDNMFEETSNHIESNEYNGLSKLNGSFSHFVINRKLIDELGYFDERLLGFGEEDGDITYRMIAKKGKDILNIYANGIHNVVSDVRHDFIKPGIGKYSLFNREFVFKEKYKCGNSNSGISGMFGVDCDPILDDIKQYPYEEFFMKNKNRL